MDRINSVRRRFPKPADLRPLLQFSRPVLNPTSRRLRRALTVADLRDIARRRTPRAAFDYVDGGAEEEISLTRTREAFAGLTFRPRILRDVSRVDTGVDILGRRSALPFGFAPTGFTRMMHSAGESAVATSAAAAGIPFALSTMGTTSIEDVAAAAPGGRRWFQLYIWKDRDRSLALIDRAVAAGYDTLIVTVDVPVGGARLRDVRNGMTIPPTLTVRTVLNAIPRPAWWFNFLTTEPLSFASLGSWSGTVSDLASSMFDPSVGFDDLAWLRDRWPGALIVKGVQDVDDAVQLAELGVDGIVVSNHGGRQLDRAPVPLRLLPQIRAAVGPDFPLIVDTGIMSGQDIVACLAAGADFALIGRAYLYGLMAGGQRGVDRTVEILRGEIERTMKLLGVSSIAELGSQHIQLDARAGDERALDAAPRLAPERKNPVAPRATADGTSRRTSATALQTEGDS
jgi:L-lactate dehydrogenase (cytochrome)